MHFVVDCMLGKLARWLRLSGYNVIYAKLTDEKILEISQQENITDFIASKVKGPIRQHNCFKVGVANCPNACSQVQITDFAVIGKVKVDIDKSSCINCGKCVKFCFENALILNNGELEFNKYSCIGCGMCVKACKEESINLERSVGRGIIVQDIGFTVF